MKIDFSCQSCGKAFSVSSELAGKKAKCKKCGQPLVVPHPAQEEEILAAVIEEDQLAPSLPIDQSVVSSANAGLNNPSHIPQHVINNPQHAINGTVASNPGNIKISKLRYLRSYPTWFWIWHGLGLICALLCYFVSLLFIPLVLFFGFCCFLYWRRVTTQFRSGCANPAKVVSIDPPLVAAFTNLTKGALETNIIKIAKQPIKKFSTGMPTLGQKIATIALYENGFPESQHWSSFDPKPVNCVTGNDASINQVLSTFTQEDWQELEVGLAQVPQPFKPGHYRVYSPAEFQPRAIPSGDQIKQIVMSHLQDQDHVFLFQAIQQEMLTTIAQFVPHNALSHVWGIITEFGDCSHAMVFSDVGVFYNFKDTGTGQFGYADIVGALSSDSGLEIMLRGGAQGRRIQFAYLDFRRPVLSRLDMLFDQISGRLFD